MEINAVNEKMKKIKEEYRYQKDITYFVEINDKETSEQIFQTTEFKTIQDAIDFVKNYCSFIDTENYDMWLMYFVEDGDIDYLADIVFNAKSGKYECRIL